MKIVKSLVEIQNYNMTLATCAKDVKFYRWPNICYVGVYETPMDCMSVKTISWSSDGKEILAVKSKGNPVIITVPPKPDQYVEPYECVNVNHATVGSFSNANPNLVAFGCEDGTVFTYDVKSGLTQEHKKLPSPIQNLEFSSDDQFVAAGCINGQIFLCDSKLKPCASFMVPNNPTLSTLAYSKFTPNLLAGASKEGVVCLWDTETTDSIFCKRNHYSRITDIAFFTNGFSSVGTDGKFVNYDLRSCTCTGSYELDCPLSSLAYLIGSFELGISTTSGQLRSYDSRNMKSPLRTLVASINGGIKKIAFPYVKEEILATPLLYPRRSALTPEDDLSGSGDFSIVSDSSTRRSGNEPKPNQSAEFSVEDNTSGSVDIMVTRRNSRISDMEEFGKILEEKIKSTSKDFEEKLLQTFYGLRINTSKQFIGLEEKISQSWNNFVDYLKLSGSEKRSREVFEKSTGFSCHSSVKDKRAI